MYYLLQISLYEDFHELVVNKTVERVTQYELEKDLEYFTIYWWRVKAVDAQTGTQSPWSDPCWFKITAEDVIIYHKIDACSTDDTDCNDSYIIYGSEIFGLSHEFVTDTDYSCTIPEAQIGVGLGTCAPTSGVARIGVASCCSGTDRQTKYCTGVWIPDYECPDVLAILTEDYFYLETEDGLALLEEY